MGQGGCVCYDSSMTIHFICRGNAFRSIIAEAYLKSLGLKNVEVISSGTVAGHHRANNEGYFRATLALLKKHDIDAFAKPHFGDQLKQRLLDTSDIAVCANQIVYDECKAFALPKKTLVWQIVDLGEKGRIANSTKDRERYSEDVYQEIVKNVDSLVRNELTTEH